MKKNKLTISIALILSLLIFYSVSINTEVESASATTSFTTFPNQPSLKDLVDASPILIDYDSDFESYGFPGDGSAEDPYRIENYNITTTGDYCINFGGYTTKHFIIQNCFLKTDATYAIFLGKYQNMEEETVNIYNNKIISTTQNGLRLNGGIGANIEENFIVSLDGGIDIRESNFTYVKHNRIVSPSGILLLDSNKAVIHRNVCNETTEIGIKIVNSNETNITHNNCSNNADTGISAENSLNLSITSNYLMNNFFGMRIMGSSGSLITNNSFISSTSYGLNMSLSVGINKIYHNAFYDNNLDGTTIQALDDTGDQWYNEVLLEGNFWSDWSSATSSTYTIDGAAGSEDLYPLDFVPEISEYSSVYISFIMISIFLAIPLFVFSKKRK